MAPENSSIIGYFSRLNELYANLDNALHPMPKKPLKKWREEKFVVCPGFAPQISEVEGDDKRRYIVHGCIYFDKLNETEQENVNDALSSYMAEDNNILLLPSKFCRDNKKCPGHHSLEDAALNSVPANLSCCYVYFLA